MRLQTYYVLYAVTELSVCGNEVERERITEFDEMPSDKDVEEAFENLAWSELKATFDYLIIEKQWRRD